MRSPWFWGGPLGTHWTNQVRIAATAPSFYRCIACLRCAVGAFLAHSASGLPASRRFALAPDHTARLGGQWCPAFPGHFRVLYPFTGSDLTGTQKGVPRQL